MGQKNEYLGVSRLNSRVVLGLLDYPLGPPLSVDHSRKISLFPTNILVCKSFTHFKKEDFNLRTAHWNTMLL